MEEYRMNTMTYSRVAHVSICKRFTQRLLQIFIALTLAASSLVVLQSVEAADKNSQGDEQMSRIDNHSTHPVSVIDRSDIELSGMTNVSDLLASRRLYNSFGLERPYILGSGRAALLVNGHPISDTTYDLNSLPISAIERIEVFGGSAPVFHSSGFIAGAINIILRRDFEGIEVQLHGERPTDPGADAEHVSSLWGGAIGAGHITIGVDAFYRDNIRDTDRDHTRSTWTEGGSFATASNVSFGGNTVLIPVTINARDTLIARHLGDCPDDLYTGVLERPRGIQGSGCGFPYGNYQWSWGWRNRESVFLNFEHPFGEASDMYVDARWSNTDYMSRMAPSVGTIELPNDTELPNGNSIVDEVLPLQERSGITLPTNGSIFVAHRFLGHGNRDTRVDIENYDLALGLKGQFVSGINYDTQIRYYRHDNIQKAGTYVSENALMDAITAGHYDLENPLSQNSDHLNAIRDTGLHLTKDYIANHKKIHATLNGTAFKLDGGDSLWVAGAEFVDEDNRNIYDYRDVENNPLVVESDVIIGSAGNSYAGNIRRKSAYAEMSLPLRQNWDVVIAGRHDDYHDVGAKFSQQISSRFRFNENLTVRGSWSKGGSPPSLYALHHEKSLDYPYICDTINLDNPNDDCLEYQVQRENISNPNLKPDDSESVSFGFVKNLSMFALSADWFRIKLSKTPVSLPAQMIVDLKKSRQLPANADVILGDGNRISKIKSPIFNSGASVVSGVNVRAQTEWQTDWADMDFEVRWLHLMQPKSYVAGVPNPYDTPSERVHATLLANRGNLTASWNVSFVSGFWNSRETYRYKSWIGHDVTLRWKNAFGKENVDLTTGILNVSDRGPATDPTRPGSVGAVSTLDSLRGRTFFLTTKMSF